MSILRISSISSKIVFSGQKLELPYRLQTTYSCKRPTSIKRPPDGQKNPAPTPPLKITRYKVRELFLLPCFVDGKKNCWKCVAEISEHTISAQARLSPHPRSPKTFRIKCGLFISEWHVVPCSCRSDIPAGPVPVTWEPWEPCRGNSFLALPSETAGCSSWKTPKQNQTRSLL